MQQIIEEIRQWVGTGLTLAIAIATGATALLVWRANKPIIEASMTREGSGLIRLDMWITNPSRHTLVLQTVESLKPKNALVGASAPNFSPKPIWNAPREIAHNTRENIKLYIQPPTSDPSPPVVVVRLTMTDRRLKRRTHRYTIKRSMND